MVAFRSITDSAMETGLDPKRSVDTDCPCGAGTPFEPNPAPQGANQAGTPMNQVTTLSSHGQASIEDVCTWLEAKAERGELPSTTARLKCTALRQIVGPIADDEPRDAKYVLENVEALTKRWATLNSKYKSDTALTYASRVKSALEEYFRWQTAPTTFRFRPSPARPEKVKAETLPRAADVTKTAEPANQPVDGNPSAVLRSFPLPDGREFCFSLPANLSETDVRRIGLHLMTYATDWDPKTPMAAFAMVRSQS